MRRLSVSVAALAVPFVVLFASSARAECPDSGTPDSACETLTSVLAPSAAFAAYFPRSGALGPWVGGGAELVFFTWSNNSNSFGPGQGKLRFDVEGLASTAPGGAPAMVLYRGGAVLSFEGNASRNFLIPYWGASIGGMHQATLGGHGFVDADLGLYLLYTRHVILDAEGAFVFPFKDFEPLAGLKTQLTASFALW
jgi:hypothetical protein